MADAGSGHHADGEQRRGELRFIGTATVLLRWGQFTILTDPNFLHRGDYAKLGGGLRSRRLTEPALTIEQLPQLDFIVLSHHHGDHFDEIAQRDLDKDVPILTTPHAAKKLRRQRFREPVAMPRWDTRTFVKDDQVGRSPFHGHASMGPTLRRHFGSPSSRRRAWRPRACSLRTA